MKQSILDAIYKASNNVPEIVNHLNGTALWCLGALKAEPDLVSRVEDEDMLFKRWQELLRAQFERVKSEIKKTYGVKDVNNSDYWEDEVVATWDFLANEFIGITTRGVEEGKNELETASWTVSTDDTTAFLIDYASQYRDTWLRWITETSRDNVLRAVQAWLQSGEHFDTLVAMLAPIFGEVRAKLIATTEVTRLRAMGNQAAWEASGIVSEFTWHTGGEGEVTCDICLAREGQTYPLSELSDMMPEHPNCRCFATPVIDEKLYRQKLREILSEDEVNKVERPHRLSEPTPRGFVEFYDADEAEAFIKSEIPELQFAEFGTMDKLMFNNLNKTALWHYQRFPEIYLGGYIKGIGGINVFGRYIETLFKEWVYNEVKKSNPNAPEADIRDYADYSFKRFMAERLQNSYGFIATVDTPWTDVPGVYMNDTWDASLYNDRVYQDMRSGWHPPGTDNAWSNIVHEFGHALDEAVGRLRHNEAFWSSFLNHFVVPDDVYAIQDFLIQNLSRYAAEDFIEKATDNNDKNRKNKWVEVISESWMEFVTAPNPRPVAEFISLHLIAEYEKKYGVTIAR